VLGRKKKLQLLFRKRFIKRIEYLALKESLFLKRGKNAASTMLQGMREDPGRV
jgi:hypothetical protein